MPDYGLFGAEHVRQYEATGGKVGHDWNGAPVLVLHTTGRRSGQIRKFPLIYGRDDNDYVIVASKGGAPEHPGMVPEPGRALRRGDPSAGQGPARQGAHRDGRRQEARLAHHDGAMARVRQVPGRDQARHSGRAAQPPLKPDERQLEDSVGSILASYARQGEPAHLEGGSLPSREAIWEVASPKPSRAHRSHPRRTRSRGSAPASPRRTSTSPWSVASRPCRTRRPSRWRGDSPRRRASFPASRVAPRRRWRSGSRATTR